MKILQKEVGALHISADIGCHSFATLPPFNMGNSIMGYGLGAAGASAFGTDGGKRRTRQHQSLPSPPASATPPPGPARRADVRS